MTFPRPRNADRWCLAASMGLAGALALAGCSTDPAPTASTTAPASSTAAAASTTAPAASTAAATSTTAAATSTAATSTVAATSTAATSSSTAAASQTSSASSSSAASTEDDYITGICRTTAEAHASQAAQASIMATASPTPIVPDTRNIGPSASSATPRVDPSESAQAERERALAADWKASEEQQRPFDQLLQTQPRPSWAEHIACFDATTGPGSVRVYYNQPLTADEAQTVAEHVRDYASSQGLKLDWIRVNDSERMRYDHTL